MGKLDQNERITRILKLALESQYKQPFVTERWGRGVYWRWIGYLPREPHGKTDLGARELWLFEVRLARSLMVLREGFLLHAGGRCSEPFQCQSSPDV